MIKFNNLGIKFNLYIKILIIDPETNFWFIIMF